MKLWFLVFAVSVWGQCPKTCTLNTDCPSTDPNITSCCKSGLCGTATLLPPGSSCTLGRTQDQICAATSSGGGACAYQGSILGGLQASDNQGSTHPSDEMCIVGQCQFSPVLLLEGCSCTQDTQCQNGYICLLNKCAKSGLNVGDTCTDGRQCNDNPDCSNQKCAALPFNASCSYRCSSSGRCQRDVCYPNQCLQSTFRCGTPLPLGSPCIQNVDTCAADLWCSGGFCKTYADVGENCSGFLGFGGYPGCKRNLVCDQSANPLRCIQMYSKAAGANCTNTNECTSKACIGGKCFGGTIAGKFCNGTNDCGEDYSCDCKVNQCVVVDTSIPCYGAARAFINIFLLSLFGGGEPPDNTTLYNTVIDFFCCEACVIPGSYVAAINLDCAARTFNNQAANPCSGHPGQIVSGCSSWNPVAPTAFSPTTSAPTPKPPTPPPPPTNPPPPTPPTVPPPPTTRFPTMHMGAAPTTSGAVSLFSVGFVAVSLPLCALII